MDLSTGLRLLRERWKSIVAITVISVLLGVAATWRETPRYSARATLFVSSLGTDSETASAYTSNLAAQQRVKSYTQLVRSQLVMTAVRDEHQLTDSPAALATKVTAAPISETAMFSVTATDPSPAQAQAIANAVAVEFVRLLPELEAAADGRRPAVRVTVVTPAGLPSRPVSPEPTRNLTLALILGLLAGIGFAIGRHTIDTTVKNPEQLGKIVRAPSLGTIAADPKAGDNPLVTEDDPYSPRAEAFRKIRANLQFIDVDRTHKVILVTSSIAGEGKSSTACNIAISLADTGKRVLLIDADLRRPRAARYLGLPTGVGLTSVLVGRTTLAEATQRWGDQLAVLASGPVPPNPSELLGSRHMRELLGELREAYDTIIIDGPPVLPVADAPATAAACDGTILVVRYGKTRREQVQGTVTSLQTANVTILGTVLNMVPARSELHYEAYGPVSAKEERRQMRDAHSHDTTAPEAERVGAADRRASL